MAGGISRRRQDGPLFTEPHLRARPSTPRPRRRGHAAAAPDVPPHPQSLSVGGRPSSDGRNPPRRRPRPAEACRRSLLRPLTSKLASLAGGIPRSEQDGPLSWSLGRTSAPRAPYTPAPPQEARRSTGRPLPTVPRQGSVLSTNLHDWVLHPAGLYSSPEPAGSDPAHPHITDVPQRRGQRREESLLAWIFSGSRPPTHSALFTRPGPPRPHPACPTRLHRRSRPDIHGTPHPARPASALPGPLTRRTPAPQDRLNATCAHSEVRGSCRALTGMVSLL